MEQHEMSHIFSFNNELPSIFEAVNPIYSHCWIDVILHRNGRPQSLNRQSILNSCAENLKQLDEQS